MADKTAIEWTESTWNPIVGCSVTSPGCTNCYAMGQAARITRMQAAIGNVSHYADLTRETKAGPVWTGELRQAPDHIRFAPLRWRRPRRIFVNSMSDLFHEIVPDAWIDEVFAVMALCPQHTFQCLTKRSKLMNVYSNDPGTLVRIKAETNKITGGGDVRIKWPLPNAWLGISAENQRRLSERWPDLQLTKAAVRWVSAEPLLGPIDFTDIRADGRRHDALTGCWAWGEDGDWEHGGEGAHLDWIVVGGESGPNARPMHPDWARAIRDQCAADGVAFLHKQNGEFLSLDQLCGGAWEFVREEDGRRLGRVTSSGRAAFPVFGERLIETVYPWGNGSPGQENGPSMMRVGKKAAGRFLDGVQHDAYPASEAVR